MTLISFQHSVKYIFLQLAPYSVFTIAGGYMAWGMNILWYMVYLTLSAILLWRLITLTSVQYYFTHDMLIISKGVIFKKIECRALWQLKGIEIRHNRLLGLLHISHIQFGLQGPPSFRVRITGVDDKTLANVFAQLNEAIENHVEIWRNHFNPKNA